MKTMAIILTIFAIFLVLSRTSEAAAMGRREARKLALDTWGSDGQIWTIDRWDNNRWTTVYCVGLQQYEPSTGGKGRERAIEGIVHPTPRACSSSWELAFRKAGILRNNP